TVRPCTTLFRSRAADDVEGLAGGDLGEVDGLERVLPALGELAEREAGGVAEGGGHGAREADALEDLGDLLAPVLLGHEVPDALPAAVGEVAREAGDVGEVVVEDGVAEVHVALGVPAERAVLREPLVEPERDLEAEVVLEDGLDGAAVEDVVDDG